MTLAAVFRPEAQTDLLQTRDWYERQQPGLGELFSVAMEEAVIRIEEMPEMYATPLRDVRRGKVRRFPHLIYYRVLFGSNRSNRGAAWKSRSKSLA